MEQWLLGDHFSKDTANTPHVHRARIALGAKENFRSTIPQSHNLKSVHVCVCVCERERERDRERE